MTLTYKNRRITRPFRLQEFAAARVFPVTTDPGTGNTETGLDGDPQFVANLTVWESLAALETFVFNTLHFKFFERRKAWFEPSDGMHFVMRWVPEGHRPTLDEARARLAHRAEHGDSDHAFGWDWGAD